MYIDAHTHLNTDKLFVNWQKHLADFENIGGQILINSGADDEYNQNGLFISKNYQGKCTVKSTIGFHPYEAISGAITHDNLSKKIDKLKDMYLAEKEHIVAIGECGIDTHYKGELNMELQRKLFRAQLNLAKDFNLPIVVHSRDDFETTIEILKEYHELKIYIHCRGYGPDQIEIMQNTFKNLWVGFDGNITYPNAQNIRDSLKVININNLLLETDAPYLTPQIKRGETNSPANVKYIYEYVSGQLSINENELKDIVNKNCDNLYFSK